MSKAARDKMEFMEYASKLNAEEKAWAERFYREYYTDLISYSTDEEQLIKANDAVIEARKNHNARMHDAFEVAGKLSRLDHIDEKQDFLEAASDEWEWRDAFTIGGYELAAQTIFLHSIRDLKESGSTNTWMKLLANMYVKMNELRKLRNRVNSKNETRHNEK